MAHLYSGKSSTSQSPHKAHLLEEFEDAKRSLAHKEDKMQQLVERMQRIEDAQEIQVRERRWEPRRTTRNYLHYGSKKEEHD